MPMAIIVRLAMAVVLALVGWTLGVWLDPFLSGRMASQLGGHYSLILAAIGALAGFALGPVVLSRPYASLRRGVHQVSTRDLIMGTAGLILGLAVAALLAIPLALLPGIWGQFLPLVAALLLGALGVGVMTARDKEILSLIGLLVNHDGTDKQGTLVLLDTSVVIDGRVADISQCGFISGVMVVPRFVLEELQHIADSADVLRRNRGRRGLEILNKMQQDPRIELEISDMDVSEAREVDGKLIKLARKLDCPILTNDYNLNRVAELQGVRILNINELANAVKAIVLPGETLRVHVIQEGKEIGQGVGYLDDGTMVVVEDGRRYINTTIEVAVTRVLQTVAGRMIFGQPQTANGRRQGA